MLGTKARATLRHCCFSPPSASQIGVARNWGNVAVPLFGDMLPFSITIRPFSAEADKPVTHKSEDVSPPISAKRNTNIIRIHPDDYKETAVGMKKPPLLARRGEAANIWSTISFRLKDEPGQMTDKLARLQTDFDLRPATLKRILTSVQAERDIKEQRYKSERVAVLGRDLGAAHFIVARKGRIRFMGHQNWISTYQKVVDPGDELPSIGSGSSDKNDLTVYYNCTMPVRYDPNYRVEALDAQGVEIRYEGLQNLGGLNYLKWLSLRENKYIDDWCLDRIFCNHGETLEYLDLSGCKGVTLCGLSSIHRIKNLRTLVVENMPQIKDLEVLCATLEDHIPGLICHGIDYQTKIEELRKEGEELEEERRRELLALEDTTLEITPPQITEGNSNQPEVEAESATRNQKIKSN